MSRPSIAERAAPTARRGRTPSPGRRRGRLRRASRPARWRHRRGARRARSRTSRTSRARRGRCAIRRRRAAPTRELVAQSLAQHVEHRSGRGRTRHRPAGRLRLTVPAVASAVTNSLPSCPAAMMLTPGRGIRSPVEPDDERRIDERGTEDDFGVAPHRQRAGSHATTRHPLSLGREGATRSPAPPLVHSTPASVLGARSTPGVPRWAGTRRSRRDRRRA